MKIPIQNIYYLLCYAWDKLEERDIVSVEADDKMLLADLFARVLINGTNHLVKRGFDRGYVSHHEWTGRLRGRICFQEAIRQNATRTGRLPCDFDEFSYDVLHNQILKATMRRLIRTGGLATKNAEALAQLCRLFSDIQDIELAHRVFGQVQLHRNNQFYDFLLKVCELIYDNLLVSEKPGTSKFIDFLEDEAKMRILFEKFVRNFYHTHTHFDVGGEQIQWLWESTNQASKELLPRMLTDISMTSETRKLIIDCKFTPQATQQHHEAEKLRSSHLYQINAYMENLKGKFAETCEMILLYPCMGTASSSLFPAEYTHEAHKIRICTINLDQPWQGIHNDLLALVA
jgi:5-methylcytosine-specific restriction enzyme subunit McrC